jgi:hypothetical protein
MKEFFTNWVKDNQVKITSPVIGAFISSWILFNWDRFLLLFWGEGKLPERLKAFQDTTNFSDAQFWFWPLLLALIYVFGLPYLNILTQIAKRHAELLRHNEVVDTDITKEKKLAMLNEEKYKSNPERDYLGKKITFELEQKEAETKKAKDEAEQQKSETEKQAAEAMQARALAEQEEARAKSENLELHKKQQIAEKEKQSQELLKANFQQKLLNRRFPSIYLFISQLDELLLEQEQYLTLSIKSEVIALVFGYSNIDAIFDDDKFNHDELEKLSFVIYDDSTFLDDLQNILDKHDIETVSADELFGYIEGSFDQLDVCKFISRGSIEDEARDFADTDSFELIHDDIVTGSMADTNAYFDEVDDVQLTGMKFNKKSNTYDVEFTAVVNGQSHENKGFSGDTLDVTFSYIYMPAIGINGLGAPVLSVKNAKVRDYYEE